MKLSMLDGFWDTSDDGDRAARLSASVLLQSESFVHAGKLCMLCGDSEHWWMMGTKQHGC